ncbi:MAG: tyrosine-protein phosphatase [Acidobacteriota bacterium]
MKNRTDRLSAVVCALMLLAAASQAQQEPSYKELPNFHKVSERLYRGAQPRDGGIRKLAELGIKTIINLRGEDERISAEQSETKSAGLRYFNIPMPGLSAASNEQVSSVLAIIDNPENQPVFIHCKHGSDRTGTITAIYRISHDGWTGQRAIAEARRYGMSWAEFGMRRYIADYYKQQVRSRNQPAATTSH